MDDSGYRSGFIALIGRPNVGKSTLLNQILGEKIAIISDKPQTTRTRILGVRHLPDAQLIFLDTPGIHKPQYRLNQRMVRVALEVLDEVDLVFFMVEATGRLGAGDRYVLERLKEREVPVILVINKIDLVQKRRLLPLIDASRQLHEFVEIVPVSALTGDGVEQLVNLGLRFMPQGPMYFKEDMVTDQPMQVLAAELIREKILQKTRDELPFSVAVQIESFTEEEARASKRRSSPPEPAGTGQIPGREKYASWRGPGREGVVEGEIEQEAPVAGPGQLARISAIVYVEKESQKAIVIGKRGELLKAVGTEARLDMEHLFAMKVYLQLWVKVKEGWRQDEQMLTALGY
jgi:GTP-binding protein Era